MTLGSLFAGLGAPDLACEAALGNAVVPARAALALRTWAGIPPALTTTPCRPEPDGDGAGMMATGPRRSWPTTTATARSPSP